QRTSSMPHARTVNCSPWFWNRVEVVMQTTVPTTLSLVPERVYPGTSATCLSQTCIGILGGMAATESLTDLVLTPSPSNETDLRRRDLAAFLRSRRERVSPEQVGLRHSRRRRTPGLRREEVAQLAGVGVTWYTWLEQGRDIRPSAQVLDAIARTLQFD